MSEINGTVSGTRTSWAEAVGIKLEHKLGRLWLLFEPTIWLENKANDLPDDAAKAFRTRRLAGRYNKQWNDVLWTNQIEFAQILQNSATT